VTHPPHADVTATPTGVEAILREQIRRDGPLSFRDVMDTALYHPEHGYYTNLRGFGPDGDFITSPERHPAFGFLLARQALEVWHVLDRPRPFRVLELGAGSGALAEPFLAALRQEIPDPADIAYTIDEASPSLREVQRRRLADPAFRWSDGDEPHHFILANEVADALPVHRAIARGPRLHELLVALDEEHALTWVEASEPHAGLEAYMAEVHHTPPDGSVLNICLELDAFVQSLARRLERGLTIVLDYTASPPRDSLLTYFRHTVGSDPLVRLGRQDISAAVDLRTLVRLGIRHGLKAGATAQRGLLLNLGFQQVLGHLAGQTDREALGKLVEANGLGGQIAVVFFLRGMPAEYRPVGAVGEVTWPEPVHVPRLIPDQGEQDFLDQWKEAFSPE
jgi:SAM-dependent MidA family methyltransferase